jgi:hypothetical protein
VENYVEIARQELSKLLQVGSYGISHKKLATNETAVDLTVNNSQFRFFDVSSARQIEKGDL